MKHQIIFHPLARLELFESKRWYAEKSLIALRKFQVEVTTLLSILEEEPEIFQIVYGTKRNASLKKFPYSFIYALHNNKVLIFAVFHHSRNPKVWKTR